MKERAVYSIMALVLVLGMALTLATPVGAATPGFSGDVEADFIGPGILTIPDPGGVGDVGLPTNPPMPPPGTVSGWDMVDLRLTYDAVADTLYVGVNTFGIAGDADGDGAPGVASTWLLNRGGLDNPDLASTETIAVYFDLDQDGNYDVIAGVSGSTDISGFTVANFTGPFNPPSNFGTELTSNKGSYWASPSGADPDFEFTILYFSTLPGQDALLGGFEVCAFMGSIEDDGVGEDSVCYEQSPSTITTIVSSAPTVVSGDTVNLTVTEANTGTVNLTSPYVEVLQGATHLDPLGSPDSGDAVDPGVLNVGETWTWTITSNAINALTTFVARGSGIAPGDFPVDYVTDPLEQDEVQVDTIEPDTITTIGASETLVDSGASVTLTVTEHNSGDDPLTNPYVEVQKNGSYFDTLDIADAPIGDGGVVGVLDPGETWTWTINSGAITALTTFEALGFGTDSLGNEVSFAQGYLDERDTVDVDTIEPDTITTIGASATTVYSGDSVTLTVTEQNTGDDPLTNPYVEVQKNGSAFDTLDIADAPIGDGGVVGVLDPGETWTWTINSGAITTLTTFEALGFGTDSLGNEVSFAQGYLDERDTVDVDTIEPDTITTIGASETLVQSGDSVLLTVTEQNTGDDPLTNPYVEVYKNGGLLVILDENTIGWSHDINGDNVLDVGETWTWTINSGAITATTTFEALGFGTDSLGNEVSFAQGYLDERDTVDVDTIEPDTITTIGASETLVDPGDSVLLTVTERNTGGDPLTNPYVEVYKNGGLLVILDENTIGWSHDINGDNVLDVGETWTWTNIDSGPITATTTFEALGFGTDSLGQEVSYATGHYGERDTVRVDVKGEGCLEICKFQDSNVNGIWDPGEPWLPDWKFHVTGPAGYDRWVTTGPDGCVVLLDLVSGTYTVTEELKAGWYNTRPGGDPPYEQQVIVEISPDCARVEFGNREEIRDLPPQIPTLNQWGIIAMIIVFAGLLVWAVRRKRLSSRMS